MRHNHGNCGSMGVLLVALYMCTVSLAADTTTEEEEMIVTEERENIVHPTTMLEILNAHDAGRRLFSKKEYAEAYDPLLVAAKGGFKESQARLGYLFLHGEGVDRNTVRALGWFGVAAEGRSRPGLQNYFNDLMKEIPKEQSAYAKQVVDGYIAKYGAKATRVSCDQHKAVGSHISQLKCVFDDAHRFRDELNAIDRPRDEGIESISGAAGGFGGGGGGGGPGGGGGGGPGGGGGGF